MKSSSSFGRWALVAAAAIAAAVLAAWLLSRQAQATNPATRTVAPPVLVTSARVRQQDVPIYDSGVGTVTPAQTVTVHARVDGQLDTVAFTEGQDVKAGQLLVQIDPRTFKAQLEQAQAQKGRDEAQLANARVDLQRYTTLITEDAATQQQLDTQRALVAQLDAAVRNDQAQIDYAAVQLSFTTISAPISGRIGARLIDRGNIVHATDAGGLLVINQIDPITVVFTLPDGAFQDINRAQRASRTPLQVIAYPREGNQPLASGTLILVNNQIDTATGTVQLKGLFANPEHQLWPGQYVNVRLLLGRRDQALTVPEAVVQRSPGGNYAYVVDDDARVRSQAIRVARIQDGVAVIDEGLQAGQRVVVAGQYKLKPGASVVEAAAAASAPASSAVGAGR